MLGNGRLRALCLIAAFAADAIASSEAMAQSAIIEGQAFLRQRGGGIVTCAGTDVLLFPDLPGGTQLYPPPYPKTKYRVQCNAAGRFTFTQVPPGRWVLATTIHWTVCGYSHGGALEKHLTVPRHGRAKIVMSDQDLRLRAPGFGC